MFKYNANDTMKLLRKQNIMELGNIEENFWGVIRDIMTANGIPEEFIGNKMFMMGVNIVQYGAILGKRIERQRNKSKYGLSASQRDYMRAILEIVQNNIQGEDSYMIYKLRIATMLSAMRRTILQNHIITCLQNIEKKKGHDIMKNPNLSMRYIVRASKND